MYALASSIYRMASIHGDLMRAMAEQEHALGLGHSMQGPNL